MKTKATISKEINHYPHCECRREEEAAIDVRAQYLLGRGFDALDEALLQFDDLHSYWLNKKDKRHKVMKQAVEHILQLQEMLNPLASNEDIMISPR